MSPLEINLSKVPFTLWGQYEGSLMRHKLLKSEIAKLCMNSGSKEKKRLLLIE